MKGRQNDKESDSERPEIVRQLVEREDLEDNDKLLSEKEISRVRKKIDDLSPTDQSECIFISKKLLATKFSIIKTSNGTLYAVYYGQKKNKLVGSGSMGSVKLAQNLDDGTWEIVKVQKRATKPETIASQDQEVEISKQVGLTLGATTSESMTKKMRFKILMKIIPGQRLDRYFKSAHFESLNDDARITLGVNILSCIQRLHEKNIVHRDIHDENIIVDTKTGQAVLFDFGISEQHTDNTSLILRSRKNADVFAAFRVVCQLFGFKVHIDQDGLTVSTDKTLGRSGQPTILNMLTKIASEFPDNVDSDKPFPSIINIMNVLKHIQKDKDETSLELKVSHSSIFHSKTSSHDADADKPTAESQTPESKKPDSKGGCTIL